MWRVVSGLNDPFFGQRKETELNSWPVRGWWMKRSRDCASWVRFVRSLHSTATAFGRWRRCQLPDCSASVVFTKFCLFFLPPWLSRSLSPSLIVSNWTFTFLNAPGSNWTFPYIHLLVVNLEFSPVPLVDNGFYLNADQFLTEA